jgi:glycosyl transferase family 25
MSYINDFFDKIFYINLKKDVDRNNYMISQFEEFNITNYERFEAIECNEVPQENTWRNFIKNDIRYIKGSIGCRNSHLGIIKLAKERKYKNILILEDDIMMLQDPSKILEMNLNSINIADMFYFGGLIEPHYRSQVVGAYAYAITERIYNDILEMAIPSGMEIDNFYAKIIQHMSYNYNLRGQYNIMMLQPFNSIVVSDNFQSNIR